MLEALTTASELIDLEAGTEPGRPAREDGKQCIFDNCIAVI